MKKKIIIKLIFALPILVSCQTSVNEGQNGLGNNNLPFYEQSRPDARGIISYDKYQVVIANGNETVLEIAKRLNLDPRKFSLFNGLVESYRPRQGEMLALNKNLEPIKKTNSVWSQKNTKDVLERVKDRKQTGLPTTGFAKHNVEAGETIYSIARLYNVSVTSLAKLNKLDAEFTIYIGQNIIVPTTKNRVSSQKYQTNTNKQNLPNNKRDNSEAPLDEKTKVISKNTFILPVKGKIVSKYNPNSKKGKNQGIDFAVSPGAAVFAAASGNIALITDNTENFGKIVLIRHENNLISIYGRVAKVLVKKNEIVSKGQRIGLMAEKAPNDKNKTILHFELRKGTKSVNPENYFE